MSRHESMVRLRHMLDHAREAVAMAKGKTRDDLHTDRMLNLALVRLLEIVGKLPAERLSTSARYMATYRGPRLSDCATA
jgi:uncharacterized protein with HEPN domain